MSGSVAASAHGVVRAFECPRSLESQAPRARPATSAVGKSLWIAIAWLFSALVLGAATPAAAVSAAPVIASISPSSGSQAGGTQVHVFGSNLDSVDTAIFGVDTLAAITHVSNVELIVTTPAATTLGAVNLQLFGQFSGQSNVVQFTYTAGPPTISSVDNPTGPQGGGTTITIHGSFLANPSSVMFGANPGTIVSSNYYEIVATSPAGAAAGNVAVTVITAGGTSNPGNFNYEAAGAPLNVDGFFYNGPTIGETAGGVVYTYDGEPAYSFAVTGGTMIPGVQLDASSGQISGIPTQLGPYSFTVTMTDSTPGTPRTGSHTFSGSVDRGPFGEANYPPQWEARVGQVVSRTYGFGANYTAPLVWSLSGNVPVGITVDSGTGTVHGAATQEGLFNFTLTATDSTTGAGPIVRNFNIEFTATASLVTPVLTGVSPNVDSATGGLSVVLTGSGFLGAVSVRFGGDGAAFTIDNDTQITATSPAHVAGIVDIVVSNEDRSSATSASSKFTFVALPVVTSLSPNRVALAGGDTVIVTGTGFDGATGVSVDGVGVAFTQISGSQVSFTAPAHAAGVANIVVTTAYGPNFDSADDNLTYVAAPTVTAANPPYGSSTAGATGVVITGTDFTDVTQVWFGDVQAAGFAVNSATQITASAPAHATGGVSIKVVTAYGEGTGGSFAWVDALTVGSVTASTGAAAGGTVVTITGTNFTPGSTVSFGGVAAFSVTVVSSTSITATTPAHAAGVVDVIVTSAGGTGTLVGGFTYIAGPAITGVSPVSGSSLGGTTVVITGTGFTETTGVLMTNTPVAAGNITVNSDTQITIITPARTASTVDIRVITPYGQSPAVTADRYQYITAPTAPGLASPTVNATVPTGTPTFSGTKQGGVTTYVTVYIDGVAIGSTTANTGTGWSFTPTTPIANGAHIWTARTTNTVTGLQGNAATARNITINAPVPAPTVSSISPSAGNDRTTVTITGTNFTGATSVSFGSVSQVNFEIISDTVIRINPPEQAVVGAVPVTVTTPSGTSSANAGTFEYIPAFALTSFTPPSGPEAGGTVVTLTGDGLRGVTTVSFGQGQNVVAAASFQVISDTEIQVVTPPYTGPAQIGLYSGLTDTYGEFATPFQFVPAIAPVEITTTSLPDAQIAAAYEQTLTAAGGSGSYAFAVTSGDLPAGLALVGDKITGTPTAGGPFAFTITATDTAATPQTDAQAFTLTVLPPEFSPSAGADAVSGVVGEPLAYAFTYSGGTGQLTYSYTGDLPDGVTFTDGAIAGTPTEAGVFVFTVIGTDESTGEGPYGRSQIVTLTVTGNPPTVTSISPDSGPAAGGSAVTLTGTDFTGATAVSFGGAPATGFTLDSATQITATAPAGSGTVNVTVTTPGGTSAAGAGNAFAYIAAPTLSSVSPNSGSTAGGTAVTLSGSHLSGATLVSFGGVPASSVVVVDDSTITATTSSNSPGTTFVAVITPGGTASLSSGFTFVTPVPAPTVTSFSPNQGPPAGGTSVVITGTAFTGATSVTFDGASVSFVVNSATQITVVTPAHAAGGAQVQVTTPSGQSALSASTVFFYMAPTPTVTAVSPAVGPTAGGQTVVVTGTDFTGVTAVYFVGAPITGYTVDSATQITLTTPAHAAGSGYVNVQTASGVSTATSAALYAYADTPTVTSLSANRGPTTGGNAITVSGANLEGVTAVSFGGVPAASFSPAGAGQLFVVPPTHAAGAVNITVTTPGGTSAASAANAFTFVGAPTISSVSPAAGSTSAGQAVVVTGTNFEFVSGATFGGTQAADLTVDSPTQITLIAPAHAVGSVDIEITNLSGASANTAADNYLYVAQPTITSLSPSNGGAVAGGTSVTITGANLTGATSVMFGAAPATGYTVNSDTSITATAPAGVAGSGVSVTVTTAGGTTLGGLQAFFSYAQVPVVAQASPSSGPSIGGTTVTITGSNFTGATAVTFGATAATGFTVNSATQITATAPAGTGTVDIRITAPGGTSATGAADQFTYVSAPTVTAVSPTAGPSTGGTSVTITGSNFSGATAVTFGATAATGYTVNSATQITATAPAGTGTVDIRVTTVGGTSATTAADQFTYVGAPTVTAVSPTAGPATGGTSVTITGSNFSGATAINFGATAATGFTVNSATQITATAPAGTGTVDVRVTTVGGTSATSAADQFTYVAAPAAPSVATPANGSRTNDATPTYSGTGANGATITVLVDGASVGTTTVSGGAWSLTQPTALGDAAHTVKATATNAGGVSPDSNTNTFIVDTAAPAAPIVTAPVNGAITTDSTPTFTGTAEANSTVRIFIGGSFSGLASLVGTTWTYTPATLADATYSVWATATDVAGNLGPQSPTLTLTIDTVAPAAPVVTAPANGSSSIDDTPTITGTAEANTTVSVFIDGAQAGTTTAVGGSWSFTSGALAIGPHTVKATATDAGGSASADSSTNTFTVQSPVTLPTANPSAATVGVAYSTSFAASGGAGTYSYESIGALPAGLTLNPSTGALSGTATQGGTFNFQIKATDTANAAATATQAYVLTVNAATIVLAPTTLPAGDIGVAYSRTLSATGGTAPYSYAMTAGAMPNGVTLDETSGVISGTPTTVGAFNFTVTATDSSTGTGPYTGARAYAISINQVLPVPGVIMTTTAYNTAVGIDVASANSGFGVPTGATVVSGPSHGSTSVAGTVITYTPATGYNGPDSFIYSTSNTAGTSATTATVSITVGAPSLSVSLPSSDFQVGAAYSGSVSASGGQSPYSYQLTAGALPTGVGIDAAGAITGTPTAAGAWSFTIKATDSSSGTAATASQTFSGTVSGAVVKLPPMNLPAATVAQPYSASFGATGGTAPYSYAFTGGALPNGLTLSPAGVLSGAPTAGGSFEFIVTATDSSTGAGAPFSGARTYQLTVQAPAISVTPTSLPAGQATFAYSQALSASGGVAPYAFAVTAGELPEGLTLTAGGVLSGTPTTGGAYAFTVTATDASTGSGPYSGASAYSLTIGQPPAPTVAPVTATVPYNSTGQAITLLPSGVYASLSVTQPAHGSVSVSGTTATYIPAAGYFGADSFTYTATGAGGTSSPATVSITVGTPAAPTAAPVSASVDFNSAGQAITLEPSGVFTSVEVTQPSHGSVSVTGSTATYTPTTGYFGTDSFTYTATGPGGTSAPATVTVTIAQPDAPAPDPQQPPATVVTGGTTTIDLADYAVGEITGFRVTDPADHGQFVIGAPGARVGGTTAAAQSFTATYTPAANFMGVDTVTVVAFGPGGDSAPIVISFNVAGTAPNLSANVLATGFVDIHPTTAVVGGPFQGVRITSAPAFGTASVNGLDVRFTPGGASTAPASIGYVIELPFGDSQPGVITITVAPVPVAQDILATTPAGRPVTVSLTATATGGPFTAAAVTGISPTGAGTATITEAGPIGARTYSLTFTPADAFTGVADIGFTLSNASGASSPAFVRVTVVARPDPSLDPDVRGLVTAQAGATQRFADGQTDNFNRRLEQIRDGSNESSFGLRLNPGADEQDPQEQQRQRLGVDTTRYDRDWFVAAPEPFVLPTLRAAPAGPPAGRSNAGGKPSVVGVWTAGNIDFGRRDVQTGERDNRFTTSALSGGADFRISDTLVIGGGLGFGEDVTKIGDNGTRSEAETFVGAVYAGFHPNETVFLDGVLGYGDLSFDTRRYDPTAGVFTFGSRSGDMTFGSVTAGLQQETDGGLRWSPYGRVDVLSATLDAFTESGAGIYDLTYEAMDISSQSGTLGVRAWWEGAVGGLSVQPRTRLEWVYEFNGDATQVLRYADWLGSPRYSFDPEVMSRSTIQLELGLGMDMGDGFVLDFDYRGAFGDSGDTHGFRFGLKGTF